MLLVGMFDSPYVRRVAVAMIAAGVAFEHKPISLFRHIDAFTKLSPLLKAPSLVTDDGVVLVESSVILEYLATLSPERSRECSRYVRSQSLRRQRNWVSAVRHLIPVCEGSFQGGRR